MTHKWFPLAWKLQDINFLISLNYSKKAENKKRQSTDYIALQPMGDFTFWLRLSLGLTLSLNFGLSTYLSLKVKWFRWAKTWRLTRIV